MKKNKWILLILSLTVSSLIHAKTPNENLGLLKTKLEQYHDSGAYSKDIEKIVNQAEKALVFHLKNRQHTDKKPAILLDIDETSLSNYDQMRALDFGGSKEQMAQYDKTATDPVITPTLALFKYAKANGVAVIFLTGRHENVRDTTVKNLQAAGYADWDKLILRDAKNEKTTAAVYKSAVRKQLVAEGYDIIINLGDQTSDLTGGNADHAYKLPNPYYFIP